MTLTPDTVRAARRAADEAHSQLVGNDSACAPAKSGQSYQAAKF